MFKEISSLRRGDRPWSMEFNERLARYEAVPVTVLDAGPPLMVRLNQEAVERDPARLFATRHEARQERARWNDWLARRTTAPSPIRAASSYAAGL
jgi:hypothetical protein